MSDKNTSRKVTKPVREYSVTTYARLAAISSCGDLSGKGLGHASKKIETLSRTDQSRYYKTVGYTQMLWGIFCVTTGLVVMATLLLGLTITMYIAVAVMCASAITPLFATMVLKNAKVTPEQKP